MKIPFSRLIALLGFVSCACTASAAQVEFQVKKVIDSHGPIYINLFKDAAAWDQEVASQILTMPVTVGTSKLQVDLPPGEYAIFLYQDLNGDGQLQRTGFGFPSEPYAFSNDVQIQFSKPSWDALKFSVPAHGTTQAVNLNQP